MQIDILDVGHGNAAVLRDGPITVIVDAAPGGVLLSHLEEKGIDAIDLIIISHADHDHIGGLLAVLNSKISVKRVILNADGLKHTKSWSDLVFALDDAKRGGEVEFMVGLTEGELIVQGAVESSLYVLSPSPALAALGVGNRGRCGRDVTSNSISAVIRVCENGRGVAVLAGDMDDVALAELERNDLEMTADILVYPHHGGLPGGVSVDSFVKRLVERVKPSNVVFSSGRGRFDNPREEVVIAVRRYADTAYISCTQLSERCAEIHPGDTPRKKMRKCAGGVNISVVEGSIHYLGRDTHEAFVRDLEVSPMCIR